MSSSQHALRFPSKCRSLPIEVWLHELDTSRWMILFDSGWRGSGVLAPSSRRKCKGFTGGGRTHLSPSTLFTIVPPHQEKKQPKAVTKKMVIWHLLFGFGLHEAPHMGDTGENESKRWDPQLLVLPDFSHSDLRVNFAFPDQPLFVRELSWKVSVLSRLAIEPTSLTRRSIVPSSYTPSTIRYSIGFSHTLQQSL